MRDYLEFLSESMIDFPREDLCPEIWAKRDDTYVIREDVKKKILEALSAYPLLNLRDIAKEIRIVGSITSNQYADDADIDVHVVPDLDKLPPEKAPEDWQKDIFKWYKDHRDEIGAYVGQHPIEFYLQLNPTQDYLSPGIYDLMEDEWLKSPQVVSLEFDPYEAYKEIFDRIRYVVEPADILLGELKRDVVDYEVLKKALEGLPAEYKEKVKKDLEDKLREIEYDIKQLMYQKKRWIEARRLASQPKTPEQALKDIELAKSWADRNVMFKLLSRYSYMKVISALEKMMEDERLTDDEIELIGKLLGGRKNAIG